MASLALKLKDVIARHIDEASPAEVARIVGSLAGANGAAEIPLHRDAPAVIMGGRFSRIGADGRQILDPQDGDHVAVHDAAWNLTWSRRNVGSGRMNWKDADAACRSLVLAGHRDWRLPTIQELLSIVDYERSEPAIDTSLFDCEPSWYWTSTPVAASPAVYAWVVGFSVGASPWTLRDYVFFVRAVRPGQ